jgi:predicted transcriptional regulator
MRTPRSEELCAGAAFDQAFPLLAFQVNRHLVDHMLRMVRAFDLDLETLMIWGVLAHQNVAHLMVPGALPVSVLDERGRLRDERASGLRPLRIRDLVQITGFPRETIRRKVLRLEESQLVQRSGDGWITNPEGVPPEVREFTRESVRRLLVTARVVGETLTNVSDAGSVKV